MDQETARTVVLGGAAVAAVVWLLGVRAFARISADSGRRRRRVPVARADPAAVAALVRWGTQDGRRVEQQGGDRVVVVQDRVRLELVLVRDTAGPALDIGADLTAWRRRMALAMGIIVLGVAPAVLLGLTAVLYYVVAPSASPGVRWQVLQMAQCVHVLWPPFLIAGLYRRVCRQVLEAMPDNLRALIAVAGT